MRTFWHESELWGPHSLPLCWFTCLSLPVWPLIWFGTIFPTTTAAASSECELSPSECDLMEIVVMSQCQVASQIWHCDITEDNGSCTALFSLQVGGRGGWGKECKEVERECSLPVWLPAT